MGHLGFLERGNLRKGEVDLEKGAEYNPPNGMYSDSEFKLKK